MDKAFWEEYQTLQQTIDLQKTSQLRENHGSETLAHFLCKALAFRYLRGLGYRVSSEVNVEGGEIDLVAYHPERLNYAVECETNIKSDTMASKLNRYVYRTGLDDMLVVDVDGLPSDIDEAREYVIGELGV